MTLTHATLLDAVRSDGIAFRSRIELEPVAGRGEKVAPPTYAVSDRAETKYAVETRRSDGEDIDAVVLDSVASQANRLELALLAAHRRGELTLPLVTVDFREAEGIQGLDTVSSLEAPHRIYDAILRDSLLGDRLFRLSEVGVAVTEASPRNAAAVYRYAPHTLVFGGWDSTGPRGGRGAKYERALTSEIVATGISTGSTTASRIDPVAIERSAGPVYEGADGGWTTDAELARKEKGKPVPVKSGGEGDPGRPSQINHGNIAPSIDTRAGGITADEIHGTTVLSLIQLRRLRFPLRSDGTVVDDADRAEVEAAGQAALAALGLAAIVLAFEDGFDLRSRCVLHAPQPLELELLRRGRREAESFSIDRDAAAALLAQARDHAASLGLVWEADEVTLRPTDGLVELVRRSQDIAAQATAD